VKVLLLGAGGREQALAWKLTQSPQVDRLFVAPGSDGIAQLPRTTCVAIAADAVEALVAFAGQERIDLTVVGPEGPLVAGVVDRFRSAGLVIFGPTQQAAQLEGSKAFAKLFMVRQGIPTARHAAFTDFEQAKAYIERTPQPYVVKADGLAAGKGVVVSTSAAEAIEAARTMLIDRAFGDAGRQVVLEERLAGAEASLIGIADGRQVLLLESAQDHKRIGDGDTGPNTGGMGAYSPAPVVTPVIREMAGRQVIQRAVEGLATEGMPFTGALYAGLMITADGPKVLEYNVRFGDPETQAILPRLRSDLAGVLLAAARGELGTIALEWDPRPCVCVVLAAAGYPGKPVTGQTIAGFEAAAARPDTYLFHAGTRRQDGRWVTAGGRVLNVVALGATLSEAIRRAYEAVGGIHFEGMQYRRDIGARALARDPQQAKV